MNNLTVWLVTNRSELMIQICTYTNNKNINLLIFNLSSNKDLYYKKWLLTVYKFIIYISHTHNTGY